MSAPQPQAEPQLSSGLRPPPPAPSLWPPCQGGPPAPACAQLCAHCSAHIVASGLPCRGLGQQPDEQASAQDPMSVPTPRAPGNFVPTFPLTGEPTWARALLGFLQRLFDWRPWFSLAGGSRKPRVVRTPNRAGHSLVP